MIQSAFNSLVSSNTLLLEEAKTKVRDSVEADFKSQIEQQLPNQETINSILGSQDITTTEDLQKVEAKFNQLKFKTNSILQKVDNKISQLQQIKGKISKINNNFDKLSEATEVANKFVPTLNIIIAVAPNILAFFTGLLANALAEKKIEDGLDLAKSKIKELSSVIASLNSIQPFILKQTSDINKQVDPAIEILERLKAKIQENLNYIDTIFLQIIAQYSGLLDPATESEDTPPSPQFNNPSEILNNLENSNKEKFFIYINSLKGNTGYEIIKK
tara:strand:+ start:1155 stop:1976 length:822 start_codon:yes stop_codon:yes gene_type:complete